MKYIFITVITITLYASGVNASTVISPCYSSDGRYEYILGEPIAGNAGSGHMLTAGFLQGIIEVVESGVEDAVKDDGITFRLFPNPVKAMLRISRTDSNVTTPDGNMEFYIFGSNGAIACRCTLQNSTTEIDLSHLANGVYIVCVTDNGGMKIFESKIIKRNP